MDFDGVGGGSDACLDLADAENNGLSKCLVEGEHGASLNDVYGKHCTSVSLADFLVIAAEAVMNITRQNAIHSSSAAPVIDFQAQFHYGRKTGTSCKDTPPSLPNAEEGCAATERVLVNTMGLSWRMSAALMGTHTLGRAMPNVSGYDGWWAEPESSRLFNNKYYISLLANGWTAQRAVGGNKHRNQWQRGDERGQTLGQEMMLNTDLCLAYVAGVANKDNPTEATHQPLTANDTSCCAWISSETDLNKLGSMNLNDQFKSVIAANDNQLCGGGWLDGWVHHGEMQRCCQTMNEMNDCGAPIWTSRRRPPAGPAFRDVLEFAADETAWLRTFAEA